MSKYNLKGANISANSIHIGDSYVYATPKEFLEKNDPTSFSDTEKELVKVIFDNTNSDEERQNILESLKAIRNENTTTEEKKKSFFTFKPLISKLKTKGKEYALNILTIFIKTKAESLNLSEIYNDLFQKPLL